MAMAGPQIGGVSLILSLLINLTFYLKRQVGSILINSTTAFQRIFRPSPQGAK